MIAPDTAKKPEKFRMRIKRQDGPEAKPYWQTFEVDYRPNMNVISALQWIAANPTTVDGERTAPVVWDCNCLEEVCGACTMLVNGEVTQSCSSLIDDLLEAGDEIVLEPMTKFPVVRDLFADRSRLFEDLKKVKGWVPIDNTYHISPGPKEPPGEQEVRYDLSRCMSCGCCLEACPQYLKDNDFVGAAVIGQVRYFNLHDTGRQLKGDRLDAISEPGGIADCGNAQNCVKACPKDIRLTEAIGDIGRQTTIHAIKSFFRGK